MRFLRRALSIILRLMLLAVILLAILARTQFLHQLVRDQVVALVNSTYRGTLSIGRIQGSVWGSLRLDQVALSHQGKQIVSIPRLSLEYSLVPLLWRQVKLRIFVESPQIKVSRLANGQWNLLDALAEKVPASTKSTERALTIALTSVRVSNGHLQVLPSGAHGPNYRADEVKADMSLTLSSLGVAAKLHSLTATISGPKIPVLYTAVAADYAGVNSPPALRLRDLDLRTQQSTISLSGGRYQATLSFISTQAGFDRHCYVPRTRNLAAHSNHAKLRGCEAGWHRQRRSHTKVLSVRGDSQAD